jgi:murein L,D-transpeptidase YafK
MARSSECTEQHAQKVIDTAGIVRDAMFRQQWDQSLQLCPAPFLVADLQQHIEDHDIQHWKGNASKSDETKMSAMSVDENQVVDHEQYTCSNPSEKTPFLPAKERD